LTVQVTALRAYETSICICQSARCLTSQNAFEASLRTSNVVGDLFPKDSSVKQGMPEEEQQDTFGPITKQMHKLQRN